MISAASAANTAMAGFLSMTPRSKVFSTVSAVWRPMSMIPDGLTVTLDPIARSPAAANPFTMGGIQVVKPAISATSTQATSMTAPRDRRTGPALVFTDWPSRRPPEGDRRIARPPRAHRGESLAHRGRLLRLGVHLVRVVDRLDVRERRHGLTEQRQLLGRVHPDRAVQLERLLVALDAPELAFHGVEPRHACREIPRRS